MQKIDDLKVYKKADKLTYCTYLVTKKFPKEEVFGLTSQIRRAAVSITSNIVEGFERRTKGDFIRFINISKGSLGELNYLLKLANQLDYLDKNSFDSLVKQVTEIRKMLSGLKNSLANS